MRKVVRPTSGTACRGRGDDAEGVHVRGLALVRRHAGGGVALDVLDRAEALAHGEANVLGGHVVLEVDEGSAVPCHRRGHGRRCADAAAGEGAGNRSARPSCGGSARNRGSPRRPCAAAPAATPSASAAARPKVPRQAPAERSRCGRRRRARRPARASSSELAARLREEVHPRRPAAGHQQERRRRCAAPRRRRRPAHAESSCADDAQPAAVPLTRLPARTRMPAARAASTASPSGARAQVGDGRDCRRRRSCEVERGAIGARRRRDEHGAVADAARRSG